MAKQRKKKRPPAGSGRPASAPSRPSGGQPPTRQAAKQATKQAAKATRQERLEAAQRQRRRRQLLKRGMVAGVVLVVAGVIATVVVSNRRASADTVRRLEAGACEFDRRSDADQGPGRNHVPSPAYRVDPPAGGDHVTSAAAPAVYTSPVPPDGQLVHALEHGDVILWHRPDVAPDVLGQLRDVASRYDRDVLVVPRASLTTAVAATAWHRRLLCPSFEAGPIDLFVRSFRDKGPEKVDEG